MIRTIICTILLSTACQASADTLYKWHEADGSITFSPQPPPAGTVYDTVETGISSATTERSAAQPQVAASGVSQQQFDQLAQQQAQEQAQLQAQLQSQQQTNSLPQPNVTKLTPTEPQQPAQGLAYAPNRAAAALPEGIRWNRNQDAQTDSGQIGPSEGAENGVIGSSQKSSQCQGLEKRVMSLEMRLRSELSPKEVDDTVVAIVRYQNSFDQYCG